MKKTIQIFLAVIILGIFSVGCAAKEGAGDQPLIIGMELAYPPFETKDDQGNPAGVSVDLANALGEYLGRPVKIENTNWDGLIVRQDKGVIYNRWESCIVKFNQQLLASLGLLRVT